MNNLKKRHQDYLNAQEERAQCNLNNQKLTTKINELDQEITELIPRIEEIGRSLKNMDKGMGIVLSADEIFSLKKELDDKKSRLFDLREVLPMQQQSLVISKEDRLSLSRSTTAIVNDITDLMVDHLVSDLVDSASDKLKKITFATLSQHGFTFTGKPEAYDILYKQIGEKICNKLFASVNGSVALPTIEDAIIERDLLIENLA